MDVSQRLHDDITAIFITRWHASRYVMSVCYVMVVNLCINQLITPSIKNYTMVHKYVGVYISL